jgi:hypothetical protein
VSKGVGGFLEGYCHRFAGIIDFDGAGMLIDFQNLDFSLALVFSQDESFLFGRRLAWLGGWRKHVQDRLLGLADGRYAFQDNLGQGGLLERCVSYHGLRPQTEYVSGRDYVEAVAAL